MEGRAVRSLKHGHSLDELGAKICGMGGQPAELEWNQNSITH